MKIGCNDLVKGVQVECCQKMDQNDVEIIQRLPAYECSIHATLKVHFVICNPNMFFL